MLDLTISASTFTDQSVVIINNPYSPDSSWLGNSDTGYAKYMQFYSKCFVVGARIEARFVADVTPATVCGLTVTTNSTSLTSVWESTTTGLSDWRSVNVYHGEFVLSMGVDVGKFLNKPKVLDDPQLFSTASAGPAQVIAAHFWTAGISAGGSGALVGSAFVTMECVFTDPIPFT